MVTQVRILSTSARSQVEQAAINQREDSCRKLSKFEPMFNTAMNIFTATVLTALLPTSLMAFGAIRNP